MKVIVIGSGLMGVTSAYLLRRHGHEVTVLDRREGAGRETSFANGALLTPSMPEPWNAPGCWRVLLASIGRSDAPMQLRMRAVPSLFGWGIEFLRNASSETFERSVHSNLRLALYSLQVMQSVRAQAQPEYGRAARGTLRIFRDETALQNAFAAAARLAPAGLKCNRLSSQQTIEAEPALEAIARQLKGALHYEGDETGDAHRFCTAIAESAQDQGVEFHFGTEVTALEMRSGSIAAAITAQGSFVGDAYVVAAASHSTPLLRSMGLDLPVQPVKGYSITFAAERSAQSLRVPVIDDSLHAGIVPLEGAIRIVGTAEFAGWDLTMRPERIQNLVALARQVLPQRPFELSAGRPWCGLRPMSADGVPIIGRTAVPNLLVNTGHGHLGWTMAAGSAQLLADLLSGNTPNLDPAPYALARFG